MKNKFVIIVFLLYNVILFKKLVHSRFNAEEINSVSYDVSILGVPVSKDVVLLDSSVEHFYIGNKNGQQYVCTAPTLVDSESETKTETERRIEAIKNLSMTEILDVLNSLESKRCLTKTVGWWTYEFCHNKAVYQYHVEGTRIPDDKIVLGRFDSDRALNETYLLQEFVQRRQTFYHSQFYNDGSLCDLSSKLRKTEVRFFCNDEETSYNAELYRVDEPETCQYVIHVHVSGLCKLAAFYPVDKKHDPLPIDCRPLLTTDEFILYKQQEEEAKAKKLQEEKEKLEKLEKIKELKRVEKEKQLEKLKEQQEREKIDEKLPVEQKNLEENKKQNIQQILDKNQEKHVQNEKKTTKLWQKMEHLFEEALKEELKNMNEEQGGTDDLHIMDINLDIEDDNVADSEGVLKTLDGEKSSTATLADDTSKEENDISDEELLEEFQKELQKMFAKEGLFPPVDKKALKEEVENQYGEIMQEARDELSAAENAAVTDDEATQSLASTLNKLIAKLDKAEREIEMANEQLEEAEQRLNAASRKLEKVLKSSSAAATSKQKFDRLLDTTKEKEVQKPSSQIEDTTLEKEEDERNEFTKLPNGRGRVEIKRLNEPVEDSSLASDKDRVKVRVSKIKSHGLPEKAYGKVSEETQKLEAQLAARLKKAGLDVKGGKVQVKVITSGYYDEDTNNFHMLTDDESQQFSNIIVSLLGGDEKQKEEKRQKSLEDNYNFKFNH